MVFSAPTDILCPRPYEIPRPTTRCVAPYPDFAGPPTARPCAILYQGGVKHELDAAASAISTAEGALSTAEATVAKVEGQVDAIAAKFPAAAAAAAAATGTADAGAGDASRALPGLAGGGAASGAADPYAQDPEDKKMLGTCKVPESCVIA